MHQRLYRFLGAQLAATEVSGRNVLEVGAFDANGTVRSIVLALGPAQDVCVDIIEGPCVDVVCDVHSLARMMSTRAKI